ncbi:MAG: hypothetical protein ACYT04_67820, partial [Nostoc sp.]
ESDNVVDLPVGIGFRLVHLVPSLQAGNVFPEVLPLIKPLEAAALPDEFPAWRLGTQMPTLQDWIIYL